MNYTTKNGVCQECVNISDTPEKELSKKFAPKKEQTLVLASSYERLGFEKKSARVSDCGTLLDWVHDVDKWKLHNANFCKDRLCPMCAMRREYKVFAQVSKVMDIIQDDYIFLFFTPTVRNCSADELPSVIDRMQKAWYRLIGYKAFEKAVKGYFRSLEVTHNTNTFSPFYDTYHPHFHCILAVNKSYFVSSDYINHDKWLDMWRKAYRDPTITQVDIRRCKSKQDILEGEKAVKALSSAVAEISKYAVKSADYLGEVRNGSLVRPFSDDFIDNTVAALTVALYKRRLICFGGIIEDVRRQLMLDDVEDGDLVHLDGDYRSDLCLQIWRYGWFSGVYKLIEIVERGCNDG